MSSDDKAHMTQFALPKKLRNYQKGLFLLLRCFMLHCREELEELEEYNVITGLNVHNIDDCNFEFFKWR